MSYVLLSCVLALSQMFPTVFKSREIHNFVKALHLVAQETQETLDYSSVSDWNGDALPHPWTWFLNYVRFSSAWWLFNNEDKSSHAPASHLNVIKLRLFFPYCVFKAELVSFQSLINRFSSFQHYYKYVLWVFFTFPLRTVQQSSMHWVQKLDLQLTSIRSYRSVLVKVNTQIIAKMWLKKQAIDGQ